MALFLGNSLSFVHWLIFILSVAPGCLFYNEMKWFLLIHLKSVIYFRELRNVPHINILLVMPFCAFLIVQHIDNC